MEENNQTKDDASGVGCNDLLGCPFCGGDTVISASPVNGNYDRPDRWVAKAECECNASVKSGAIVHVYNSYTKAPNKAKSIARRKWNARVT